jgi:hypothetical protein
LGQPSRYWAFALAQACHASQELMKRRRHGEARAPTSCLRSPSCKGTLPRSEPLHPCSRLRLASTNKPPTPATATVLSRPSNSTTGTSAPHPHFRKQLPRSGALHFAPTPSPPPPTPGSIHRSDSSGTAQASMELRFGLSSPRETFVIVSTREATTAVCSQEDGRPTPFVVGCHRCSSRVAVVGSRRRFARAWRTPACHLLGGSSCSPIRLGICNLLSAQI